MLPSGLVSQASAWTMAQWGGGGVWCPGPWLCVRKGGGGWAWQRGSVLSESLFLSQFRSSIGPPKGNGWPDSLLRHQVHELETLQTVFLHVWNGKKKALEVAVSWGSSGLLVLHRHPSAPLLQHSGNLRPVSLSHYELLWNIILKTVSYFFISP